MRTSQGVLDSRISNPASNTDNPDLEEEEEDVEDDNETERDGRPKTRKKSGGGFEN